jgi:4a-hydroxytetrahydrobiopterin dehydratase
MDGLARMHCVRVTADTPRLQEEEMDQLMAQVPTWKTYSKEGELHLEKKFKFENFRQAIAFTYQVAQFAEEEDHHPTILTEWGGVTVTWWTHRIKGLHRNDFIMAAKTDNLYAGSAN